MKQPPEPGRVPGEPSGSNQQSSPPSTPHNAGDAGDGWHDLKVPDTDWHSDDWHADDRAQPVVSGPWRVAEDGAPAAEIPERAQPSDEEQDTGQATQSHSSVWKTLSYIALAGVLVFAVARAVLAGFGGGEQGAIDTRGGGAQGPLPLAPPEKPPSVLMGGAQVPAGGPVVTLNPGLVRQGARVGINGIGFDPGAFVDLQFTPQGSRQPVPIPGVPVTRDGSFTTEFVVPQLPDANGGTITAVQRGSNKGARADAQVQAGVGFLTLSRPAGRPGDVISVSANGFQPNEKVNAYWGRLGGIPTAQLQADPSGGMSQVPVKVGVGAVGNNTLILVGDQSKTTATAGFTMIGLYPNATVTPYAFKAAQPFGIGGNGFVPGERVMLYVNNSSGPPVAVLQADNSGNVGGNSYVAPFGLKGRQTLTLIGEQSRATAVSGFMVLPYTPTAQPSTWGGMPGTSMTFYAKGFAPNEVVLVLAGQENTLVSAFRVDARGNAAGKGAYTIPSTAQNFASVRLQGRQSGASATVTVTVQNTGEVSVPPPPNYVLPPELATDPQVPGGAPPPPPPANPPAPPRR